MDTFCFKKYYEIFCFVSAPTPSGSTLGTFCGRIGNQQPLISTRNSAAMKFTTDFSVNRTGFSVQYKAGRVSKV